MINVHVVPPELIYSIWEKIAPMLEASFLESTGDCTTEQLKLLLVRGDQTLFVAVDTDNEEIVGASTVEMVNYPNNRVGFITALGGKGVVTAAIFENMENWMRVNGATKVYAYAKEAQARLYRQKSGFEATRYLVEKKL